VKAKRRGKESRYNFKTLGRGQRSVKKEKLVADKEDFIRGGQKMPVSNQKGGKRGKGGKGPGTNAQLSEKGGK